MHEATDKKQYTFWGWVGALKIEDKYIATLVSHQFQAIFISKLAKTAMQISFGDILVCSAIKSTR